MKFKELIDLADKVADKINRYVSIGVDYHNHRSGTKQLRYSFYEESYSKGTVYFKSALVLKSHMENILNEELALEANVAAFGEETKQAQIQAKISDPKRETPILGIADIAKNTTGYQN